MAVVEAKPFEPEVAPDVRGPTAPLPATILVLGTAAFVLVVCGVLFSQVNYALSDRSLTQTCIDQSISPEDNGAVGVCNIVEALLDPVTTWSLVVGIGLGAVAIVLGLATYRRMDSRRRRDHAVTGAIMGVHAITLAAVLLWFRAGSTCAVRQALPELRGPRRALPRRLLLGA